MTIKDFRALLQTGSTAGPVPPMTLTGRELEELLSPITPEEFVNSYFARLSLHVKGQGKSFDHIFNWERLQQALERGKKIQDKRFNLTASFASGEEAGSRKPMFEASIGQVSELLASGGTVCITNIHMADPALAQWAQAIRAQINFTGTVGVNCYVSADNAGLPMHFDKRVATTLQIAGKKRWKYSTKAAIAWPNHNGLYQDGRVEPAGPDNGKPPDEMEFCEVELNPGDVLCLPAGAWHAARGVGFSLALNVYFAPRNLFERLLPMFLDFAASNENWRGGPPVTVENIHGKMPDVIASYMRDRLDEFRELALKKLEQPDTMGSAWLTSLTDHPYTGWQPDPGAPLPKATSADRFQIVKSSLRFIETQAKVIVPCDHGLLNFSLSLAPIFRRLASEAAPFSVPEVLSWRQDPASASQQDVVSLLQALYRVGILRKL